jgi:DNA-binding FadR family transcriptional regulator
MERLGLAAQLEAELGRLPSERTLASKYRVSRATAREALVRLRARGLVEALRSRLPALLQASDERVLQALAPSCEAHGVASFLGTLASGRAHPPQLS